MITQCPEEDEGRVDRLWLCFLPDSISTLSYLDKVLDICRYALNNIHNIISEMKFYLDNVTVYNH